MQQQVHRIMDVYNSVTIHIQRYILCNGIEFVAKQKVQQQVHRIIRIFVSIEIYITIIIIISCYYNYTIPECYALCMAAFVHEISATTTLKSNRHRAITRSSVISNFKYQVKQYAIIGSITSIRPVKRLSADILCKHTTIRCV